MEYLDRFFSNSFFQLPVLEALSYLLAGLGFAAGIVSLVERVWPTTASKRQPEFEQWRKAA